MAPSYFFLAVFLALVACQANASDPSPLQDFCVADKHYPVKVNGFACKDPMAVNADDIFKAAKLDEPRNTMHSKNRLDVLISDLKPLSRVDARSSVDLKSNSVFGKPRLAITSRSSISGEIQHHHEVPLVVLYAMLPGLNTLGISLARIDYAPLGLIHFQFNPIHDSPAVAIAALSSQNPGAITITNAVFGSKPPISDDVLAKAFQVEKWTID
ncbi:unnamed protein product [Urochloa decumbens]|uniref:Germin-like protein n=1 Tax=Urochloa decumbens TaxID=240449 RepID=A0ABC9BPQ0_9POAL